MSDDIAFKNRVHIQHLSPEFIEHATDFDPDEMQDRIERMARRLERSYPLVAQVTDGSSRYGTGRGYEIQIIPKQHTHPDSVQQALQNVMYWIIEEGDDE